MRTAGGRSFALGVALGFISCIYYTVIAKSGLKILDCLYTSPGNCTESNYREAFEIITYIICPGELIQLSSIGVDDGIFSYILWIFSIVFNGLIFFVISKPVRMMFPG
jgi:hypothetical protein